MFEFVFNLSRRKRAQSLNGQKFPSRIASAFPPFPPLCVSTLRLTRSRYKQYLLITLQQNLVASRLDISHLSLNCLINQNFSRKFSKNIKLRLPQKFFYSQIFSRFTQRPQFRLFPSVSDEENQIKCTNKCGRREESRGYLTSQIVRNPPARRKR